MQMETHTEGGRNDHNRNKDREGEREEDRMKEKGSSKKLYSENERSRKVRVNMHCSDLVMTHISLQI